jgi:hypothetical protein
VGTGEARRPCAGVTVRDKEQSPGASGRMRRGWGGRGHARDVLWRPFAIRSNMHLYYIARLFPWME